MEREDKSTVEKVRDLATAIKEMAAQTPFCIEAQKRYNKELRTCILRSLQNDLATLATKELRLFVLLQSSSWVTRWYLQMRYRKAKLSRIQLERYIIKFKREEGLC